MDAGALEETDFGALFVVVCRNSLKLLVAAAASTGATVRLLLLELKV